MGKAANNKENIKQKGEKKAARRRAAETLKREGYRCITDNYYMNNDGDIAIIEKDGKITYS